MKFSDWQTCICVLLCISIRSNSLEKISMVGKYSIGWEGEIHRKAVSGSENTYETRRLEEECVQKETYMHQLPRIGVVCIHRWITLVLVVNDSVEVYIAGLCMLEECCDGEEDYETPDVVVGVDGEEHVECFVVVNAGEEDVVLSYCGEGV